MAVKGLIDNHCWCDMGNDASMLFVVRSHAYDRQDEYRAWVKNVAPMENVMRESQQVIMIVISIPA